jgi:membrane associated rhomboid family serine protease
MTYYERTYRIGFGGGLTKAIKYLLISNVAIYVLQLLTPLFSGDWMLNWLALNRADAIFGFRIWQFITYMFLHDPNGPLHIIFNMLLLWMFGGEVERTLGTREFLKYYFTCGLGGGLMHVILFPSPVVGASGAIYGIMAAFAIMFPERVITLLLFLVVPVQIKAKWLVIGLSAIALLFGFLGLFGGGGSVAHFAHLGGVITGFIYLKVDWRFAHLGEWLRQKQGSNRAVQQLKRQQNIQRIKERVDEILDKINEVGYEHLDESERKILRDASERLSQEKETEN